MKFFIINLEQDIEKREKITALCESFGLDYEIIPAVYGKALSEDEISELVAPIEEQLKYLRKPLNRGEIGCSLSHKKCYEEIVKRDLKEAIILEDDAIFNKELIDFINSIDKNLPSDLDLLLLGHYWQQYRDDGYTINTPYSLRYKKEISKWTIRKIIGRGNGTHGYYINKKGALKLLEKMKKIYIAADHYTSNTNYVNVYAIYPTVVNVDINFQSTINENGIKKRSKFGKIIKTIKQKILYFIPSLKKPKDYI